MFRALLPLLLLTVGLLCLPAGRRWLGRQLRRPNVAELKHSLWLALGLYFLLSIFLTLRDCSRIA